MREPWWLSYLMMSFPSGFPLPPIPGFRPPGLPNPTAGLPGLPPPIPPFPPFPQLGNPLAAKGLVSL